MADINSYVASRQGESMAEIAERIGVSRPYLYQLVSGDRQPSIETAVKIAQSTDNEVPVSSWPNLIKINAAFGGAA